ncbi:seven transmembrane domain protein [Heterostelium album PN500]|uniref:BOS complex subunit TMEM147 n=1 Tax=Heterostelium pallidum (strain ATCC 26659 / Pp 5 / PN500) TaxID=670386 RepID=D3B5I0_HETP5|nr:seven transmembrane domain protein [Heterostelium album PN500]EFA83128.1 seven transmembrane domain protein [Heterostelium album PN500]|eukprot:XP_020435245.1 seven transmembrane domain protein [Heterostelium album PN500]
MTVLHFLSCVSITYIPLYIAYKSTKVGEFKALSTVGYGLIGNILTQLAKMMFLATFLPSFDSTIFSVLQELVRLVNVLIDLFSIYTLLQMSHAPKDVRAFGIGLGWVIADVLPRFFSLWVGALPLEFDANQLIGSLQSNVNCAHTVAIVLLLASASRRSSSSSSKNSGSNRSITSLFNDFLATATSSSFSVLIYLTLPTVLNYLKLQAGFSAFYLLLVDLKISAFNCYIIYRGLSQELSTSSPPTSR